MKYLAAIALLLLPSCVPTVTVDPIAPKAAVVREAAKVVTKKTEAVQTVIKKAEAQTTGLVAEVSKMVAETERLKNSSGVTPGDLDALWVMATHVQTKMERLGDTQRDAVAATDDLHISAVAGEAATVDLAKSAVATDAQTATLKQKNESLRDDAGFGKSVKWIIGIVLILLLIVFVIMPLVRRAASRL